MADLSLIYDKDVQSFLIEHSSDDPHQLALKAHRYSHLPMGFLLVQIQARQKLKSKLQSWIKHPHIIIPSLTSAEQCSSELTATYKASLVDGSLLIDVTGGMGVDSWAFSTSVTQVQYIERDSDLAAVTAHNMHILECANISVQSGDGIKFLDQCTQSPTWIYLDPHRRGVQNNKVFLIEDCQPNVLQHWNDLIDRAEHVMVKLSPMLDIQVALQSLSNIFEIHLVSVQNEMKEFLILASKHVTKPVKITTVNIFSDKKDHWSYFPSEIHTDIHYSDPSDYLYEPNASVMKSGAFKALAEEFSLSKIAANTHLFTSSEIKKGFPGRIYKIIRYIKYDKKSVSECIPEGKATISLRHFPDAEEIVRKKIGLKPGGEKHVFATTLQTNKPILILVEPVR